MTDRRVLINLKDVELAYPTISGPPIVAVRALTLQILEGEFFVLVGPSGCGKSSLLRLLAGLLAARQGVVTIDGGTEPVSSAFVFQDATLLPWLTIAANVELPLRLGRQGRSKSAAERAQDRDTARKYLSLVGLLEVAERYPAELSGGMRQRVSIARALASQPRLLLMDEPFGALDAITRENLNAELGDIWQRTGITIVFVTHSIPEAVFLADRIGVMNGRPGHLAAVEQVALPRPRRLQVVDSAEFGHHAARVRAALGRHVPASATELT